MYAITDFIDVQDSVGIIHIELTKRKLPALWEQGGGYTNTGSAIIIAGPVGEAKWPHYIKKRGRLACGAHALFIVRAQDLVVEANHHRYDFEIRVWRISQILIEKGEAHLSLAYEFSQGEWSQQPPSILEAAIKAAKAKASCYHCRTPHFAAEKI